MGEWACLVDVTKKPIDYIDTNITASGTAPYQNPTGGYASADLFELEKHKISRKTPQRLAFRQTSPIPVTFEALTIPACRS